MSEKTTLLDARNTALDLVSACVKTWSLTSTYEAVAEQGGYDSAQEAASARKHATAAVEELQEIQAKFNQEIEDALRDLNPAIKPSVDERDAVVSFAKIFPKP